MDEPEVVSMDPAELAMAEPFSSLFPVRPDVKDRITASMRKDGFDPSKPINVWRAQNLIVDGHTRCLAARAAKVEVRVCFQDFADEEAALDYAIANQRDRRNITDAQLSKLIRLVDRRKPKGGDRKSKQSRKSKSESPPIDNSAQETAHKLNTSPDKVKQQRAIDKYAQQSGDTIERDAVDAGTMSINKAYHSIRAKTNAAKPPAAPNKPPPPAATNGKPKPKPALMTAKEMANSLAECRALLRASFEAVPMHLRRDFVDELILLTREFSEKTPYEEVSI